MNPSPLLYIVITAAMLIFPPTQLFAGTKPDVLIETTPGETAKSKTPDPDADKPRGQLLYENHCGECHESSVHNREKRKADSINKIRYWVTKWSKELKLNWSTQEIEEVTKHVNSSFYHFQK